MIDDDPEREFDDVEDTGELPGRGDEARRRADLYLLREAIKEQGKMLGELTSRLLLQAEEIVKLHEEIGHNSSVIRALARRLGIDSQKDDRSQQVTLVPVPDRKK